MPSNNQISEISESPNSSARGGAQDIDIELYERQQELEQMDTKTGRDWVKIKSFLVCGAAFFADAYLMFSSNIIILIMGFVYYHDAAGDAKNVVPTKWATLVKIAVQVGCLLGQLILGRLGDKFGRTNVFSMGSILVIISTIGASFSSSAVRGFNVFVFLFIWLVLVGIGVGGDYPLAATITSEYASNGRRGQMLSAVFACQGFGNLAASIVAIVVLACFKSGIENDVLVLDYVWRICLGFGAIPGAATLYWRLTMPESKQFQMEAKKRLAELDASEAEDELLMAKRAARDTEKAIAASSDSQGIGSGESTPMVGAGAKTVKDFSQFNERVDDLVKKAHAAPRAESFGEYFGRWRNMKVLLGTSISWFALDVAFYGINLNSSVVIDAIGFSGDIQNDDPHHVLTRNCLGNIIINVLGSVPGYWITVFTIERLGRKPIQIGGFAALTVLYIAIGFAYHQILDRSVVGFVVLFTLAQLFQNFGPNVTCFVWPGEVFPIRFRATAHGISAAAGKLGAIVAQGGFMSIKDRGGPNAFIPHLLEIFALFTLIGLVVSFWIPETKGKTLEQITGEEDEGAAESKGCV